MADAPFDLTVLLGQRGKNAALLAHLKTQEAEIVAEIVALVTASAWAIHNDVKEQMRASSVPSKPGGYPGVRTGRLMGSMGVRVEATMHGVKAMIYQGGEQAPYAKFLRDGTWRMAARPSLEPSLAREGVHFLDAIRAMIARQK